MPHVCPGVPRHYWGKKELYKKPWKVQLEKVKSTFESCKVPSIL